MSEKVKLSILGVSFSQVQAGAYALIFAEENGIRRLPVVIGTPEAQSIAMVMENLTPPRPLTHDLIYQIFNLMGIKLLDVFIYKFEEGAFFAELTLLQDGKEFRVDSRTSDAIAIALRTNSPIYTTEEIMQNMAIVFDETETVGGDTQNANIDIQTSQSDKRGINLEALKKQLEEAIQDENYELATKLRDEINRKENRENG